MVCDAVEGTGAVLPSRPYIEEAGSETIRSLAEVFNAV